MVGGSTHYDGVDRNPIAKVFGGFSTSTREANITDALLAASSPCDGHFTVDASKNL